MFNYSVTVAFSMLLLAAGAVTAQERSAQFEPMPCASYRVGGTFDYEGSATNVAVDESGAFGLVFDSRDSANTQ